MSATPEKRGHAGGQRRHLVCVVRLQQLIILPTQEAETHFVCRCHVDIPGEPVILYCGRCCYHGCFSKWQLTGFWILIYLKSISPQANNAKTHLLHGTPMVDFQPLDTCPESQASVRFWSSVLAAVLLSIFLTHLFDMSHTVKYRKSIQSTIARVRVALHAVH